VAACNRDSILAHVGFGENGHDAFELRCPLYPPKPYIDRRLMRQYRLLQMKCCYGHDYSPSGTRSTSQLQTDQVGKVTAGELRSSVGYLAAKIEIAAHAATFFPSLSPFGMSVVSPIADKRGRGWIVRFVPIATGRHNIPTTNPAVLSS